MLITNDIDVNYITNIILVLSNNNNSQFSYISSNNNKINILKSDNISYINLTYSLVI